MSDSVKSQGVDNQIVKLIDQQLTVTKSALHSDSLLTPYNPDDLYKKDAEYRIYENMMRDDQVSVALAIKKDLVLAAGYDIISDDTDQIEMCEQLECMLNEGMLTPFDEALTEILTSYEFGFSLTEKVFGTREDGTIILAMLKTRHPATWFIYTDDFGDVEKFEQYSLRENLVIPPENLIHFVNNRKFQNPYGTSDLRAAYEAWFIKNQIKKYYAIFMEKASSPVPIGKYDAGVGPVEVDNLFNILKKFQAKTAMVIPKTMEVDFLETKSNGEVFQKAINIFNLFIGRALYVPDLFGYSGEQTGGGSYSLGEHQINMYFRHVNRRRVQLERMVNKEIIRPLIVNNFGFQKKYPIWKLRPVKEDDVYKTIEAWTNAVKGNVYKPAPEEIDHFRSLINFPVVELEDESLAPSVEVQDNQPGNEADQMDEAIPVDGNGENDQVAQKQADANKQESGNKFAANPYKHQDGEFYKRVDFKAIESQMIASGKQISSELLPILTEMFADYAKQIAAKKIVEKADIDKIDKLKLKNTKAVLRVLSKNLTSVYEGAKAVAASELMKSSFAALPADIDERFLAILEAENLHFIGDWEYSISKNMRIELINAIKDGTPISEVLNDVTLDSRVGDAAQVALERYARTKTTELMNKGRIAYFESSDVVSGYQYSAILDDRTTAICEGLHGKFFVKGTEPVPPLHFNCRSLLIPITKYEKFDPSKKVGNKPISEFIDENIGAGFSLK